MAYSCCYNVVKRAIVNCLADGVAMVTSVILRENFTVDKPKRLGYNYMPTIYRQDGFEVMIYTNDHRPAHVHVFKADGEVVIYLGSEIAPPRVRTNIGMGRADERRALIIVGEHDVEFWMEWRRIHG